MKHQTPTAEQPRYIKLNARDNVAIVVNDFGLPAGSRFACGLTLRAFVPQGHKTALVDIAQGEELTCNYHEFDPGFTGFFDAPPARVVERGRRIGARQQRR